MTQPGDDKASFTEAQVEAWEKIWAQQIADVAGNDIAMRVVQLAKLNGLFDPFKDQVTIPQKDFATASDDYLRGFEAGFLTSRAPPAALTSDGSINDRQEPETPPGPATDTLSRAKGWQLVPKKLTAEIACALEGAAPPEKWIGGDPHGAIPKLIEDYQETWARVLKASPSQPAQSGEGRTDEREMRLEFRRLHIERLNGQIATLTQALAEARKIIELFARLRLAGNPINPNNDDIYAAREWDERNREG